MPPGGKETVRGVSCAEAGCLGWVPGIRDGSGRVRLHLEDVLAAIYERELRFNITANFAEVYMAVGEVPTGWSKETAWVATVEIAGDAQSTQEATLRAFLAALEAQDATS